MKKNSTWRSELGNVRQTQYGKWQARIGVGRKANGKQRTITRVFTSEKDAREWIVEKSIELASNRNVAKGITLNNLWDVYRENKLSNLAKSTYVNYVYHYTHNIAPSLGNKDITEITYSDIQRMLDTLKPSVARHTKATLSSILSYGVKCDILIENVMYRASFKLKEQSQYADSSSDVWDDDPFAAIEQSKSVWNARTAIRCMEGMRGLSLEPIYLACIGAGLRVEEAFALRKMDVRRIVGSYDEFGNEIWVTQLAVHHATTREEKRKSTKTVNGSGIVPMLEPFGERMWEIVDALSDPKETICKVSASRQNKLWRAYFEPPKEYHKRMSESRKVYGKLYDLNLPYIPLSRMRATHATIVQESGVLDSINRSMHRNTSAVLQRHYMRPDTTEAAISVSRRIN